MPVPYSSVTPQPVNDVTSGGSITQNTAEVIAFVLTDGTADAGSAAGTIVYGKTALSPILNFMGDRVGIFYTSPFHSSITFSDGVIVAAQEKAFVYEASQDERLTLTAAKLIVDGDWAVDYETGLFVIRKATTDTSIAIDYKTPTEVTGGGGGPATDVNIDEFGGTPVTIGQQLSAASIPVVLPAAQITTLTPPVVALNAGNVSATTQRTAEAGNGTGTTTSVASSATNVTLLAANTARRGATVFNESTQTLFLKLGATASATSYSVQIGPSEYYELPFVYTGIIDGLWDIANGNARITELT